MPCHGSEDVHIHGIADHAEHVARWFEIGVGKSTVKYFQIEKLKQPVMIKHGNIPGRIT